jgi:hypothetical protein
MVDLNPLTVAEYRIKTVGWIIYTRATEAVFRVESLKLTFLFNNYIVPHIT